jgi:hypothetical protein
MTDALMTRDMLMALEEMPPHTAYHSVISELVSYPAPISVYRCDCLPCGAYVIVCDRLSPQYHVPSFWVRRDDFVLDLGYRGVNDEMHWRVARSVSVVCGEPKIAASLAAIREAL